MGQKINPIIYRLGLLKNDWNLKFYEKNIQESSTYFLKIFFLKNFIKQFLLLNKLALHRCNITLSDSALHLNFSYSILEGSLLDEEASSTKFSKNLGLKQIDTIIYIIFKKILNSIKTLKKNIFKIAKLTKKLAKKKIKTIKKLNYIFLTKLLLLQTTILNLILTKNHFRKKKKNLTKNLKKTTSTKKLYSFLTKYYLQYFKTEQNQTSKFPTIAKKNPRLQIKNAATTELTTENETGDLINDDADEKNKYNFKKNYFYLKLYKKVGCLKNNGFLRYFIRALKKYIGKKLSIYLTLHQINSIDYSPKSARIADLMLKNQIVNSVKKDPDETSKVSSFEYDSVISDLLFKFNQYKNYDFFEPTINTVFIAMTKKNSAELLANYIANTLPRIGKTVRHIFFFEFISSIITNLSTLKKFSKIVGIQITARGRVNQALRKKIFTISIGKIAKQKINLKIDHAKAVAQTRANGSIGIEVWINYKEIPDEKI